MNIAVIGSGYVGLITSVVFAKLGHNVVGVDRNLEKINNLNQGIPTIYEKGLETLLNDCLKSGGLMYTYNIKEAVEKSDIIFIAVGTPSQENWDVDMTQIEGAIQEIAQFINGYKIIVNKSTVPVGTQNLVTKLLLKEGISDEQFDVVSNPEFLKEGKAISDFLNGDRIVIGSDSERAKNIMESLYAPFDIEIVYTTPETAELIKYASNAFLATKISFINEIANLCNEVGADVDTVAYAMGLDQRISPYFLKAGIGFGGSCFPKDTRGLVKTAEKYGCDMKVVRSAIEVNELQRIKPIHVLMEHYGTIQDKTISILGLTFKPKTDDTRESPALYIIEKLLERGAKVKCYDPISPIEIQDMYPKLACCSDIYETIEQSSCAIICTDWDEFNNINLDKLKHLMKEPVIIDGRNILNPKEVRNKNIAYYSIGRNIVTKL